MLDNLQVVCKLDYNWNDFLCINFKILKRTVLRRKPNYYTMQIKIEHRPYIRFWHLILTNIPLKIIETISRLPQTLLKYCLFYWHKWKFNQLWKKLLISFQWLQYYCTDWLSWIELLLTDEAAALFMQLKMKL